VDVKCPGSGEGESFLPANAAALRAGDELKFVLAGRGDYDFARRFLADRPPPRGCEVIFSPAAGRLGPRELAEWILADRLDVRLGIQLHRVIWPEADRGV
jgi:7-carboxy-7-deazaguanine synthase